MGNAILLPLSWFLKFRMPPQWGKTPWGGAQLAGNSVSCRAQKWLEEQPTFPLVPVAELPGHTVLMVCHWFWGLCWEIHWMVLPGGSVTCWMQHKMSWQVVPTFTLASFPTSLAPGHGLSTFCPKANTHQLPRALELCRWRALNSSWLLLSGFQHGILYYIQWDKFQFNFF